VDNATQAAIDGRVLAENRAICLLGRFSQKLGWSEGARYCKTGKNVRKLGPFAFHLLQNKLWLY
jgi:hypothetical protein